MYIGIPARPLTSLRKMDTLDDSRRAVIATAIGSWDFSAHEFSEDELVHAAFLMLEHALQMPELERWRFPAGRWIKPRRALTQRAVF